MSEKIVVWVAKLRSGDMELETEGYSWDDVEHELDDFANSGKFVVEKRVYELVSVEGRTWSSNWRGVKGPLGWIEATDRSEKRSEREEPETRD